MTSLLTLSTLKKQLGKLDVESNAFYTGEWVNLTPFMPGDYKGRTWRYVSENGQKKKVYSEPTLAQAIKSRMRYVSLLALASFVERPRSYSDVIRKTLKYFQVADVNKNNVNERLHLFNVLFGTTDSASLFDIDVEVFPNGEDFIEWRCAGKNCPDRCNALVCRKRKKGSKDPYAPLWKPPLEAGSLRMKVSLLWSDHSDGLANTTFSKGELERLLTLTLKVTLAYMGIGKGVSRGFGRFLEDDSSLMDETPREAFESLIELWRGLARSSVIESNKIGNVPSLSSALSLIDKLSSQYSLDLIDMKSYGKIDLNFDEESRRKIAEMIEDIAHSTLKNKWRKFATYKSILRCIFLLGLPRGKARYDHCRANDVSRGKRPRRVKRRQSMFYFVPYVYKRELHVALIPFIAKDLICDRCDDVNNVAAISECIENVLNEDHGRLCFC